MKHFLKTAALLVLALALVLAQTAFAEEGDVLAGIFEKLTAESAPFNQAKAMYASWFEATLDVALEGDSIVFTVTNPNGTEGIEEGTWTYTKDGDYLVLNTTEGDQMGTTMLSYFLQAAGEYWGINPALMNAYISGMEATGRETTNYYIDRTDGAVKIGIYIAGPFDMKELDEMVLTEEIMTTAYFAEPIGTEYTSRAFNFGKISVLMNGDSTGATFLLGEYGELDEIGFTGLMTVVKTMQPIGWEDFVANYAEFADAQTDGYTAKVNASEEEVKAIYEQPMEGYSYAIFRFGSAAE